MCYCTPTKQGRRKIIAKNEFAIRNRTARKRNTLKIYRKRQNKRRYFIGYHSLDLLPDGTILRNNGFLFKKYINFCPFCGRDLGQQEGDYGVHSRRNVE